MLLEHHRGQLPFWLAPEQVAVASVSERQAAYAGRVAARLEEHGLRVALDAGPDRLARKLKQAHDDAVPVFIAVGAREETGSAVSLRRRGAQSVLLPLDVAASRLQAEAATRR
jgi:threonyl-tRNA synthetase